MLIQKFGRADSSGGPPVFPVFGPPTDDRREPAKIAMSICFVAAVIAVTLRAITKTVLTKAKLWWDDWLILFALVRDRT